MGGGGGEAKNELVLTALPEGKTIYMWDSPMELFIQKWNEFGALVL